MLEVILKQDIYNLGDRGEVVRVKDGYARNYLYPKQLAIPADKSSLKSLDDMKAAAHREVVRLRGDAEKQQEALESVVVRVVARAGENNQLYGSVTPRDISAKLKELGFDIVRHRIDIKEPFRMLGDYEVPIQIYKDLSTSIKVEVRAEGREDELIENIESLYAKQLEAEQAEAAATEAAFYEQSQSEVVGSEVLAAATDSEQTAVDAPEDDGDLSESSDEGQVKSD